MEFESKDYVAELVIQTIVGVHTQLLIHYRNIELGKYFSLKSNRERDGRV